MRVTLEPQDLQIIVGAIEAGQYSGKDVAMVASTMLKVQTAFKKCVKEAEDAKFENSTVYKNAKHKARK